MKKEGFLLLVMLSILGLFLDPLSAGAETIFRPERPYSGMVSPAAAPGACEYFQEDFSGLSANTWTSVYGNWQMQDEKLEVDQVTSGKMAHSETFFYPSDFFTLDVDVEKISLPQGGAYGIYPFTTGDVLFGVDGKTLTGVGVIVFDSGNAYLTGWDVAGSTWYKSEKYPTTGPVSSIGVAYTSDSVILRINGQNTSVKFSGNFSLSYGVIDTLWLLVQGVGTHMRFDNVCSGPVATSPLPPPPTPDLKAPKNLRYTLNGDVLTVKWDAVAGASGYKVGLGVQSKNYSGTADVGGVTQVGPISIAGAPAGTYYLAVRAYKGSQESGYSNEITVTITASSNDLQAPGNMRHTLTNNLLTIMWDAVSGASGYEVGLGGEPGKYSGPYDVGNVTQIGPLDVTGLPPATYYLAARAYDGKKKSVYSNEITVHLTDGDAFSPGPVVPGSTTPESANGVTKQGQKTTIGLSDGTIVELPPTSQPVSVALDRETNTIDLSTYGMETSGSMRTLTVGFDSSPAEFTARITFPGKEIGGINPDTINIARIADMVIDDKIVKDRVVYLTAHKQANGDFSATDFFVPNTLLTVSGSATASNTRSPLSREASAAGKSAKIKYVFSTFQGNLNWTRPPLLVRMVPDKSKPQKRQPLSQLSIDDQEKEKEKCMQNIIVLVHGHNEAEKGGMPGTYTPDVDYPWFFGYKQDVWTHLYSAFMEAQAVPADCTIFYEFIYPSWRSIFPHLGSELSGMLSAELQPLLKDDQKFNLFIVAHSMGGLVSRAAIQEFEPKLHKAFQKLVTWGSPHHGGALVTVEYALTADPAYKVGAENKPGIGIPLQNIDLVRGFVEGMAMDTPGNRDLRWDNARPLRLDEWFSMDAQQYPDQDLWAKYDLKTGTWLYNSNLGMLNSNDIYNYVSANTNRLGKNKYVFLYGVTSKKATTSKNPVWKTMQFATGGEIAKGAFLTKQFIKDPTATYEGVSIGSSDGAVSVTSMAAEGIAGYRASLGDVDHEEYFGAPNGPGNFTAPDKAKETAEKTLSWLEIKDKAYACPGVSFQSSFLFNYSSANSSCSPYVGDHNIFYLTFDDTAYVVPYKFSNLKWNGLSFSGQLNEHGGVQLISGTLSADRKTLTKLEFSEEGEVYPDKAKGKLSFHLEMKDMTATTSAKDPQLLTFNLYGPDIQKNIVGLTFTTLGAQPCTEDNIWYDAAPPTIEVTFTGL